MRETWVWSWVGKIPWRRERLPTPVFRPGELHGLYNPWGHEESDTTERIWLHFTSWFSQVPMSELKEENIWKGLNENVYLDHECEKHWPNWGDTGLSSITTYKHKYLKHEEFELGEHPGDFKLKRDSSDPLEISFLTTGGMALKVIRIIVWREQAIFWAYHPRPPQTATHYAASACVLEVRKETPLPCCGPILSSHFVFRTKLWELPLLSCLENKAT